MYDHAGLAIHVRASCARVVESLLVLVEASKSFFQKSLKNIKTLFFVLT